MLLWFLVVRVDKNFANYIKEIRGMFIFFLVWKTITVFGTIAVILVTQDLIIDKAPLLSNLW